MRGKTLWKLGVSGIAIVIGLGTSQITVTAQQGDELERSIEGVWLVITTPIDCRTRNPIPEAPPFEGLWTVHSDGTLLVSLRNNSLTLERTAAHGLWKRNGGWSDYLFKFVHVRRNISTGAYAGRQEGGGTMVLNENGDQFTTDGWSVIYTAGGNQLPTGCGTSSGTRFKLEP
jgi:hypothetical protein